MNYIVFKIVKLVQMLQRDAQYLGLLLIKAVIHQVTQMVTKGAVFLQTYATKCSTLCVKITGSNHFSEKVTAI